MSRCSVPRCCQRQRIDHLNRTVTFHSFPAASNPNRQKWVDILSVANQNFRVSRSSKVCSKHFEDSCFTSGVILCGPGRRRLTTDAIPTIFAWDPKVFIQHPSANLTPLEEDISEESKPTGIEEQNILDDSHSTSTLIADEHVSFYDTTTIANNKPLKTETVGPVTNKANANDALEKKCQSLTEEIIDLQINNLRLEKQVGALTMKNERLESTLSTRKKVKLARQDMLLEKQIDRLNPTLDKMKTNDNNVKFYTGIPTYERLMALYEYLDPGEDCINFSFLHKNSKVPVNHENKQFECEIKLKPKEQFLLVLMRLRLGLFEEDLADRFGISTTLVNRIMITWLNAMYVKLGQLNIWPTRENIDSSMPEIFKVDYPTTRVIINVTEIKVEKPNLFVLRSGTHSTYKSENTLKGLLGINPSGLVTFVSRLYTGCISNEEITRLSGVLDLEFNPKDSIMADKDILIKNMLEEKGISLNILPCISEKDLFPKAEPEETQKNESLRIHIQKGVQRIRTYHILDRPIPLSLCSVADQIWTVCALLTNLQTPIIGKVEDNLDEIEPNLL